MGTLDRWQPGLPDDRQMDRGPQSSSSSSLSLWSSSSSSSSLSSSSSGLQVFKVLYSAPQRDCEKCFDWCQDPLLPPLKIFGQTDAQWTQIIRRPGRPSLSSDAHMSPHNQETLQRWSAGREYFCIPRIMKPFLLSLPDNYSALGHRGPKIFIWYVIPPMKSTSAEYYLEFKQNI